MTDEQLQLILPGSAEEDLGTPVELKPLPTQNAWHGDITIDLEDVCNTTR